MALSNLWSSTSILYLCTLYLIGLVIYRLVLSPYAAFPGPKLAGLTSWYTFYYDVIKGGQYIYKVQALHERYGPVVRIAPNEVHVNDPEFYDILFASAPHRRDKPLTWSQAFGNPDSVYGTITHEDHRVRRHALNGYFSKASIRKIEPLIQEDISRLIAIFRTYQKTEKPIPLKPAFAALTSDLITEYCFATQEGYIEAPNFNDIVLETTEGSASQVHIMVHFKWLFPLLMALPDRLVAMMMGPGMALMQQLQKHSVNKINEVIAAKHDYQPIKHRTLFRDILDNDILSPREKTADRLWQEAQVIMGAGTVTTATALSSALVYLLLDSEKLHPLMQELEKAVPDISKPPSQTDLEKLPYLTAVLQETLRLGIGVTARLARSSPTEMLKCNGYSIPPNTTVSMDQPSLHLNSCIFPYPHDFIPERWLHGEGQAKAKYLIPFSKGTRNCIGINLAWAELYLTLAMVLRTFVRTSEEETKSGEKVIEVAGMSLYETDRRDVDMAADYGLPKCAVGRGNVMIVLS